MSERVLVLVSGGLDSAVLLYDLIRQGRCVWVLDVEFPGRSRAESEASRRVAEAAGVERLNRIDLPFIQAPLADRHGYIPNRNVMFYGIAASLAEQWGIREIFGGHLAGDGQFFLDASRSFFDDLNRLLALAAGGDQGRACRILTPLIEMTKVQVVSLGHELRVPFELTWSCLGSGRHPCGECLGCRGRREAFEETGLRDPLD
ncbi:MAG: 7-cyano-7-deazaguanine synthase [Nitrospirae bacterium]|nr:7-cyano-7-deazaguanine synthase [Nitrospirota bacterium]